MLAWLQHGFRLGSFEVRPLEGRLIGPEGEEHVQPKAMEVLVCLAEHAGQVVERDEILRRVWGDAQHDDALTRTVSELRHHLDDHPDVPNFIQTVPKRGYRLVADVKPFGDENEPDSEPRQAPAPPGTLLEDLKRRRVVRVAIAYAVAAWLIIQVAETTLPALRVPDWTVTFVIVLAILGFPVAIALSWVFQVTDEGVVFDRTPRRRGRRYALIGGSALILTVAGFSLVDFFGVDPIEAETPNEATAAPSTALAVLRFQNIGADPATQYFSDGLCENLLDFLSNFTEFRVAARTSSWAPINLELDVPAIANRLKVDNVLEGSVQRSANNVRVWAQLVNAEGFHVWSQTYDRELTVENIFEIQDEIARSVADNLQVVLGSTSQDHFGRRPTHSLEALDYFMQGREYLRGVHSQARLETAVQLFDRALALDSDFVSARANLCITQLYFYELTYTPSHFEAAEKACNRALTHDSTQDDVYTALGSLYRRSGQLEKAATYLHEALTLNPRSSEAVYSLARTREDQGDLAAARALLDQAIDLQPGYWFTHNTMGTFLRRAGQSREATEYFERVIELVPDRALGYVNLAATVSHLGDFDGALDLYRRSIEVEPTILAHSNMGIVYYRLGQYGMSALEQQKAIDLAPDDYYNWGHLADARRQAGDSSAAIVAYQKAIELVDEALAVNPKNAALIVARAKYGASLGHVDGIAKSVAAALALAPKSASVHSLAARTHMLLGNRERTLELLPLAIELGESPHYIAADPDLAPLREVDAFAAILPKQNDD